MMAMTAAIADTAEAMELIAAQMLSIGFLLSDYNYYNNKLVKVFKSDTSRKPWKMKQNYPNSHMVEPPEAGKRADDLHAIAYQLTRIADTMQGQGMQVTREDALKAWPLRMYEDEYLHALQELGIELL